MGMNASEITMVADHFTEPRNVGIASMRLELDGRARAAAELFFATRKALGITGYMTNLEAFEVIAKAQEVKG